MGDLIVVDVCVCMYCFVDVFMVVNFLLKMVDCVRDVMIDWCVERVCVCCDVLCGCVCVGMMWVCLDCVWMIFIDLLCKFYVVNDGLWCYYLMWLLFYDVIDV